MKIVSSNGRTLSVTMILLTIVTAAPTGNVNLVDVAAATGACSMTSVDWSQSLSDAMNDVDEHNLACSKEQLLQVAHAIGNSHVYDLDSKIEGVVAPPSPTRVCLLFTPGILTEVNEQEDLVGGVPDSAEVHVYMSGTPVSATEAFVLVATDAGAETAVVMVDCDTGSPNRVMVDALAAYTSGGIVSTFLPDVTLPVCTTGMAVDPTWALPATPAPSTFGSPWGSGPCVSINLLEVVEIDMYDVINPVPVSMTTLATVEAFAEIDIYRYPPPPDPFFVTFHCLVGYVGATPLDPCGLAGATYFSEFIDLVPEDDYPLDVDTAPLFSICDARLNVTVLGAGPHGVPSKTIC